MDPRDRRLPIVNRKNHQKSVVNDSQRPARRRVLLVDDDRAVADSMVFMLRHEGYDAAAAYSGQEAIALALEFLPDVLIADVMMAGVNGMEAAKTICAALPQCKAMLFSGDIEGRRVVEDALNDGLAFDFVEKPLHPQE